MKHIVILKHKVEITYQFEVDNIDKDELKEILEENPFDIMPDDADIKDEQGLDVSFEIKQTNEKK